MFDYNPIKSVLDNASVIIPDPVERLSSMPALEYEKVREAEAERLGIRVSALDKEVHSGRKAQKSFNSNALIFLEVAIWQEPVNADALFREMLAAIHRFIVCDKETAIATVLWCAFTWVIEYVEVAPLAVITAPEKRCGKSQMLHLMGKLVRNPLVASNISPSATYRVIEAYHPTLLIDEADTFFKDNEELRGVINSGHTRQSAYVIRNVGDTHEPKQFSTWGAKAISGIGTLSDTLMDRAIILNLRRKLPHELVQRLRHAESGLFETLASKMARFADESAHIIAQARPLLPEALHDRAQDNWEPLLAIADCVGGDWPQLARNAALKLSGAEKDSLSLSAELLADIQEIFDSKSIDRISTADLIEALCADDEKTWATYNRGKRISPRQFAKRLSEYGIHSKTVRINFKTPRGFERAQFEDAFSRYLAPPSVSATTPQTSVKAADVVSDTTSCCATEPHSETGKPAASLICGVVADYPPGTGSNRMVEIEV